MFTRKNSEVKALSQAENRWSQLLLEAVDEGLLILGESARKSIYFHLQNTCSLMREDIPNKPEAFAEGLRRIFGAGAKAIEESIVKSLYSKLGIEYKKRKNTGFVDCLNAVWKSGFAQSRQNSSCKEQDNATLRPVI